jgi:hypothetical protein
MTGAQSLVVVASAVLVSDVASSLVLRVWCVYLNIVLATDI